MKRPTGHLAAGATILAWGSGVSAQCPGELIHAWPRLWHRADFGLAVEISGDVAVVPDDCDHTFCTTTTCQNGAVHVFRSMAGSWEHEAILFHSRISEFDGFGGAVALDGPARFVATAPGEDLLGYRGGAAYIFEHNGEAWNEVAEILPPIFPGHNGFGESVVLRGDTLVVGGPGYIIEGIGNVGAAYVFRAEGGVWEFKQLLVAPDPRLGARFGHELALDDDWLMVGAYLDDEVERGAGAVYIYRRQASGAYQLVRKLLPPPEPHAREFGGGIGLDGDSMAVGAASADGALAAQGAVYIFELDSSEWRYAATLQHDDPIADDALGASVALRGGVVVAGAPRQRVTGVHSGAAYAFRRQPGGSWRQAAKLLPETLGGGFGWAIATDGASVIVGAPAETVFGAPSTGAAHIFDLPCLLCRADLDRDGALTFLDFLAFQNLYTAGDMTADFDGSGALDFFDFLAFQDEFAAGCG
jgi:hypothetical protein